MSIQYRHEFPAAEQYFDLFSSTGWNKEYGLDARDLHEAIRHSLFLVAAYDGERLIGSGRLVSDGVLHALIVDVIVLPEYQGQGIGTAIMKQLTGFCRERRIRDVQLFCAKGKTAFYEPLGFRARPHDAPGMDLSFP
jgi:GNAT superfamily N-acetyltransferase